MPTISYSADFGSRLEAVNKMLKTVADRDTPILSMLMNLGSPVDNFKYEWVDKTLAGFMDSLSAALTSSTTTTITVSSNSSAPKRYVDGKTLIQCEDEVLLVSSTITVQTNYSSFNVTRASLGTTASSHPVSSEVIIIGLPENEGFSAGRDDSQKGSRKYNYSQIFHREVKLSGTSQSTNAVENEMNLDKQIADLLPELMKELQQALFFGQRYAADTTQYLDRRAGGFRYWAVTGGGTNTDISGNPLSVSTIDDIIEQYITNGGDTGKMILMVPPRQQRALNDLKEARIIGGGMGQTEKTLTNYMNRYEFASGMQVDVLMAQGLARNEAYIFQKDLVEVRPYKSRAFFRKPLPEDGDFKREMILGEYTFVFRNVRETLFRMYNLATA